VDIKDYSLQLRLQRLEGLGASTYMLRVYQSRLLNVSNCSGRRALLASIGRSWSAQCPPSLAPNACYYDCNDATECMHSLSPVAVDSSAAGDWYRINTPDAWVALSLLFTHPFMQCPPGQPPQSMTCVRHSEDSSCDSDNFVLSLDTRLVAAAPNAGSAKCASNSSVLFYVPRGLSQGANG
jgi:hypothetical protein